MPRSNSTRNSDGVAWSTPWQTAEPARALSVPRLTSPRTEVPAGAVAVAGEFSAVYPRTSPGGWQLIGTTHTPMWDSAATPPALVAPGDRVHYRAVDALEDATETSHHHLATPPRRPIFSVDDPGMQTLYQDLGRQGNGNLGVTTSGSADRASARTANAAVGNKRNATLLENIGGLVMQVILEAHFEDDTTREFRVPAEVWRKDPTRVTKLLVSSVPLASLVLDPHLETADADLTNNFFPRRIDETRLRLGEDRDWGAGDNPMRKAGQAKARAEGE